MTQIPYNQRIMRETVKNTYGKTIKLNFVRVLICVVDLFFKTVGRKVKKSIGGNTLKRLYDEAFGVIFALGKTKRRTHLSSI